MFELIVAAVAVAIIVAVGSCVAAAFFSWLETPAVWEMPTKYDDKGRQYRQVSYDNCQTWHVEYGCNCGEHERGR